MELQIGFHIKLLTAIKAKDIFIPKNDIVTVVEIGKKGTVVKDILDNLVILPKNAKFKIVDTKHTKAKLTAAPIPTGQIVLQDKGKANLKIRCVQLAQVMTSNALHTTDPIVLAKYTLANTMLTMALEPDIDTQMFQRLYQYAKKLSAA